MEVIGKGGRGRRAAEANKGGRQGPDPAACTVGQQSQLNTLGGSQEGKGAPVKSVSKSKGPIEVNGGGGRGRPATGAGAF